MHESSDVHTLPSTTSSEEDDALDFPPAAPVASGDAFAEFEDEIEGESTRIDEGHLLAEQSTAIIEDVPVQPFLYVERGNDQGREFVLQQGENGIGRGIDNDVILADVAVSRRHLIVIREGDVLRLRDLGSGNGTQVNGKRVSSMVLSEGDRIEVGETVMVVRTPGGTSVPALDPEGTTDESHIGGTLPPPAPFVTPADPFSIPQSPGYQPELTPASTSTEHLDRRPQKGAIVLPKPVFIGILFGGALLLAMLGAAVAILVIHVGGADDDEAEVTLAAAAPFDRGVRAYQAHRWDEAEGAFREALSSGSDPRANEYLSRVQQARAHEQLITRARASLTQGDSNAALTQASSVPADSPLAAQAQAVRTQAQARQVAEHVAAARTALAGGDRAEATRHLALARNLDPSSAEVRALSAQLGPTPVPAPAPVAAPPTPVEPEAPPHEASAPAEDVAPPRGSRAPRRGHAAPVSTADIVAAYLAGHFDQATSMARTASSRASARERRDLDQLASNIERFGRLYARIQAARFGPSVRSEMEQAIALDRRIARSGQYRDRLRPRIVDAYLQDAQRQRGNASASCSSVRQALAVDEGNARARQLSTQCETQARAMMRDAASARPERAMQVYSSVLLMVPSRSPVAREANDRLDALRRRRVVDEDE